MKTADLVYDGQLLSWNGHGSFKATSGLPGYQEPANQCVPDAGPIPEGTYTFSLAEDPNLARDDGTDSCRLASSFRIQQIPRGSDAGVCEPYWANWGWNRVRLHPDDSITEKKCSPWRGGFYLHDSTKGYTHGCIEVEGRFFIELRSLIAAIKARKLPKRDKLVLRVKYIPGRPTNGGTRIL